MAGQWASLAQHLTTLDSAVFANVISEITTSNISQDVGPLQQLVQITTSGSGAGTDLINIANPPLDANGINSAYTNRVVIVELMNLTSEGDIVYVTVDGQSDSIPAINLPIGVMVTNYSDIHLGSVGAIVCFRWIGTFWAVDAAIVGFVATPLGNGIDVAPGGVGGSIQLKGGFGDSTTSGGTVIVEAGNAPSGTGDGGTTILQAGTSAGGSGNGGDLTIDAGRGVVNGHIIIGTHTPLPTSDPVIAGALWNSSGTVKISAG